MQEILELSDSWRRHNGDSWRHYSYDDSSRTALVKKDFPEYLDAYLALPLDVERSDFFR